MSTPKYNWKPSKTIINNSLTLTEKKDYHNTMYDFKRIPNRVKEYKQMAGIFTTSGTVKNLGYRGSEEGVHVGSRSNFTGPDRRQPYKYVKVYFDGLYCDYYGEDAFTIDPLARVKIVKGQWKGRDGGGNPDEPGSDKCFQCDGGILELRGKKKGYCLIEKAKTSIRGKANSILYIQNVDFVKCHTVVRGDGEHNPGSASRYFNGNKGDCLIYIKNCRFWDCDYLAYADDGCTIFWGNDNKVMSGKENYKDSGGKILKKASYDDFKQAIYKMKSDSSNEWKSKNSGDPLAW